MAVPSAYLTTQKNLDGILEAIQKGGVPSRFTYDHMKQMGFPSSSDRPVIAVLKALKFLDEGARPLERYRRFREPSQAGAVMAEALREAYADIFRIDQNAQSASADDLKGMFARVADASDSVAQKMSMTFRGLAKHADFGAAIEPQTPSDTAPQLPAQPERPSAEGAVLVHHDIHVHLPVSTDIEVFDAIFRSLRQNLMS
jgi:hypothetical protein